MGEDMQHSLLMMVNCIPHRYLSWTRPSETHQWIREIPQEFKDIEDKQHAVDDFSIITKANLCKVRMHHNMFISVECFYCSSWHTYKRSRNL